MFYVSEQFLVKLIQTVTDPQADLMRRTGHRSGVGAGCIQIISYCELLMTLSSRVGCHILIFSIQYYDKYVSHQSHTHTTHNTQ